MTGRMENYKGIPILIPNDTFNLEDKGCYISYNYDTGYYGCTTTALVRENGIRPTKFLILNGNHMEEYSKLHTYNKCVDYFKSHINEQNKMSENWDEEIMTREDGTFNLYVRKINEGEEYL